MNHIARFSFCGLRRLNRFTSSADSPVQAWRDAREWYECASVNIFIGSNGSGKSTALELIDILRDPSRIITLPRENRTTNSLTIFDIEFTNPGKLFGTVTPNLVSGFQVAANIDESIRPFDAQYVQITGVTNTRAFVFQRNISKLELDQASALELKDYFSCFQATPLYWSASDVPEASRLVYELNAAQTHLSGILSESESADDLAPFAAGRLADKESWKPWQLCEDDRLAVYLSDDSSQPNRVTVGALPAGWRQLASFLVWLKDVPEGSICLIEEPETHLHPHLQRYLARQIGDIAYQRTLQVFITTHSSVFQQLNLWPHGANLFETHSGKLSKLNSAWRVLDALGIKGSDLSQSNGIIWVEGPSDRMYIKHWLKLYCQEQNLTEPLENVDYSFSFYGGASLSHFTLNETDDFIDMLSINRNSVIVMDCDKDFTVDDFGDLVCVNASLAKARILDRVASWNQKRAFTWITDGYTIESYLPTKILNQHFITNNRRLVLKEHRKKSNVAAQYTENYKVFKDCAGLLPHLTFHIKRLLENIREWNR